MGRAGKGRGDGTDQKNEEPDYKARNPILDAIVLINLEKSTEPTQRAIASLTRQVTSFQGDMGGLNHYSHISSCLVPGKPSPRRRVWLAGRPDPMRCGFWRIWLMGQLNIIHSSRTKMPVNCSTSPREERYQFVKQQLTVQRFDDRDRESSLVMGTALWYGGLKAVPPEHLKPQDHQPRSADNIPISAVARSPPASARARAGRGSPRGGPR